MPIHIKNGTTERTDSQVGFGTLSHFDFSSHMGEGQQILAYALVLTRFDLYVENPYSLQGPSVDISRLAVSLVPNLVGNSIYVTANGILNGSAEEVMEPTNDSSDDSHITYSVIAYIDSPYSSSNTVALKQAYGLPNGSTSSTIYGTPGDMIASFISGFTTGYSSDKSIKGLRLVASYTTPQDQTTTLTAKAALVHDDDESPLGQLDMGLIALGNADALGTVLVDLDDLDWDSPDGKHGMSCTVKKTVTTPKGFTTLDDAVVLMQNIHLVYGSGGGKDRAIQQVDVGTKSISWTQNGNSYEITLELRLNIWEHSNGHHNYVNKDSNLTAQLLVQFK